MGVPCSVFKDLLTCLNDQNEVKYYITSSEGEAMGLAAGFSLAEKTPVVYMQNDGYGNAVNPLSSLQLLYKLPAILLISWRAEPGIKDAPQHILMGQTILELLDVFKIPYLIIEDNIKNLNDSLDKAQQHFETQSIPLAFIVKKGYFDKYETRSAFTPSTLNIRADYIKILADNIGQKDILLGATGFTGRELYQMVNHQGKFYMMGSMGCLAAIGLGISQENSNRKVIVLDGDGALLMKMGTLSTVGHYKPNNLIHMCFDNHTYESTGGQPTTSPTTDFAAIAKACGYKSVSRVSNLDDFYALLQNIDMYNNPHFVYIKIKEGTIKRLERPSDSPEAMKNNLMAFLK